MTNQSHAPEAVTVPHAGEEHARAMAKAAERGTLRLKVPVLGSIELPSGDQLAFLGGIVTLGAIGVVDWPIVVVLVAGHVLANNRHTRFLRDFGRALEAA